MKLALPRTQQELQAQLVQVEAALCGQSLSHFIRHSWAHVDPNRLIWNWHIDYISELLEAVSKGQIRNLLINIPPGCMKSLSCSSLFPAWDWIDNTGRRFIASTYAQKLSNKNARIHRDLVLSPWYKERWPHVNMDGASSKKVEYFQNSAGGFRLSVSVGGSVIGFHGNIIIWDDLVDTKDAQGRAAINRIGIQKANEHRFETLVTRAADPNTTAFIGVMQRLHYGDPSQRCIDGGDHVVLTLPMEYDPRRKCVIDLPEIGIHLEDPRTNEGELLWEERFNRETVAKLRASMGSLAAAAQLDQNPSPIDGDIFNREWFEVRWTELPPGMRQVMVVDCTFKDADSSDYVVIQTWGVKNDTYYLLDQLRGKWKITGTIEKIKEMRERWPLVSRVFVEDKANGPAVVQTLEDQMTGVTEWSPGRSGKVERAEAVAPIVEAGRCYFPDTPWMANYISEHVKFPVDIHDDQVDGTTMALLILQGSLNRRQVDAYGKIRGG